MKGMSVFPILYSFRRCPYAMRARLAIAVSGQRVELREIVLRDKAPEFLEASPSASVPCLKQGEDVLDESLDIMLWALRLNDPEDWLAPENVDLDGMLALVGKCDGPFKRHLDRYKYDSRYEDADRLIERAGASRFIGELNDRIEPGGWLFGTRPSLADFAILPFVRQFANTDRAWFDSQDWIPVRSWLTAFEGSPMYLEIMDKYAKWQAGDRPVLFPESS